MKSSTLLFLTFIKIIISEICNYSFSCELNENDDYCALKKRTDSNSIFEIKVKKCSSSMPCNIYDTLLGDTEKTTYCPVFDSDNKYKNPSYPGGVCSNNSNCLSGVCLDHICIFSEKNEECFNHENCPLNTACINGKCQSYLKINQTCNDSYQCEYNAFCNKETNKCDEKFKYEDGIDITNYADENEKLENLCKSGGYIIEEGKIKCETLTNIDKNCNDKCLYKKNSNKGTYISEDRCLCGYNKYRSKYCVLGNGEKIFKDFLSIKKEFMKNTEMTKYCHTLERDNDDICLELINTKTSVTFRNYVKDYNNKKILALQHHRLQESEPCIKEVIFNYDTSPTFSFEQKCPIYSCDYNMVKCLYGKNPLKEDGNDISIILNPNSCAEKEICTLPEENKLINTNLIMERENIEGQCKIYQGERQIKRYPGENCYINSDCISENSICVNGKCTGKYSGEECNNTNECLVGLYCNQKEKKCESQKKEGEKCVYGWDCQNYLGCFKGRCIKFGSLKNGIKITDEFAPFPGDNNKKNYLCFTGELNEEDGLSGDYCVTNDYDSHWLNDKKKKPDNDGYIKCNYGEECSYSNGRSKFNKTCECGYNDKGQGYCPLPSLRNSDAWEKRIQFLTDSTNNNCHSLSRFNCYENNNYEFYVKKREHEIKTFEAHKFYNSIGCAYKMFGNQNYLRISYFFLTLLLTLFI